MASVRGRCVTPGCNRMGARKGTYKGLARVTPEFRPRCDGCRYLHALPRDLHVAALDLVGFERVRALICVARKRGGGRAFVEHIVRLAVEQKGRCQCRLSDCSGELEIDRMDSTKGYSIDNVPHLRCRRYNGECKSANTLESARIVYEDLLNFHQSKLRREPRPLQAVA